ncbi:MULTISPECIES: N,N-dimethylformamidase beta subunit family domain-containing protein [Microbacteriaceae]|uniref:N,N-dimethylformamidase beta subunit family domain-containing protein n=1 Tax=Microbacteriaceae TaxID=85023 RepID=UPI0005C19761|nr:MULTISPECIES: N,N-dimethylformamidase beta subunit family domain-containing protein [Microbacteriaceae]TDQ02292.1 hypothetical protein AXZ95_0565 [Leifsonia sp. 115AMFTsu3.1]SDL93222.1 hypothetical protein SAMN04488593_2212 [Microbacterium azadirachtae]SEG14681.1 hypothetical protein SAMN04488594_1967 [Microbacterium azadirachtae]SEG17250.1 hypothetical protein SAMN04488592_1977 [Microbacterium azadirachtae]
MTKQSPYPFPASAWSRAGWVPERPTNQDPEIWGYTDQFSYLPGDTVNLRVHTTADRYSVKVVRDGLDPREVLRIGDLPGQTQHTPEDAYAAGCGWDISTTFQVDHEWQSGLYLLLLSAEVDGTVVESEHFLVVRASRPGAKTPYVLVLTTSTMLAYNDWGGANHYRGRGDDPTIDVPSPVVSMLRPVAKGMLRKPVNAPRNRNEQPLPPFGVPRYETLEWARLNGYSRHHADAFWATYERPFVLWAEENGYDLEYLTQDDLHRNPNILSPYHCAIIVGHDEYWTWEMRDEVDRFVDAGGNIARFAANFDWQVRIEGTTQIAYKTAAPTEDPLFDTAQKERSTTSWDHPVTGRPSAQTFGLSGDAGVYTGYGASAPRGHGGLVIYRPQHWVFDDADCYYGDVLGAAPSRIGTFEVDGCDYVFRGGLPYPTGTDGTPDTLEILAMTTAVLFEEDHFSGRVPLGDAGSASIDELRDIEWFEDTPGHRRPRYGSGMMACFTRGKGTVFNSGTTEWVAGLLHRDWFVEKVTKNVLERLGAGPHE